MPTQAKPMLEKELLQDIDANLGKLSLLTDITAVLSRTLTDHECFRRLLDLMIPSLADCASILLITESGKLIRAHTAHVNAQKAQKLSRLFHKHPLTLEDAAGPGYVIRTGTAELTPVYTEEHLKLIQSHELRQAVAELEIRSKIVVPIIAHQHALGAVWMVTTAESNRTYSENEFKLAKEIADRTALHSYNLIRYSTTKRKLEQLQIKLEDQENTITQVRHDVKSVLTAATLSAQLIARSADNQTHPFTQRIVNAVENASRILDTTKNVAV